MNIAEERISELEDMSIKTSKIKNAEIKKKKKAEKTEPNIQELWNNYDTCLITRLGEKRQKGTKAIVEKK